MVVHTLLKKNILIDMINEDYCSFEVAKLLKEKGFDWRCNSHYWSQDLDTLRCSDYPQNWNCASDDWYSCPTHQTAMKWLREVYGLFISINLDDLDWSFQMFDIKNRDENMEPTCLSDSYACHKCYKDTVEAALKYSLENLI